MDLKLVALEIPDGGNLILGQSHFIKTVEDIYEAIVTTVPQMKFGVAFNEASGPCLTRVDGNDDPSPMTYNSPKPEAITEEDKVVEKFPLKLKAENVVVRAVGEVFQ